MPSVTEQWATVAERFLRSNIGLRLEPARDDEGDFQHIQAQYDRSHQ